MLLLQALLCTKALEICTPYGIVLLCNLFNHARPVCFGEQLYFSGRDEKKITFLTWDQKHRDALSNDDIVTYRTFQINVKIRSPGIIKKISKFRFRSRELRWKQ